MLNQNLNHRNSSMNKSVMSEDERKSQKSES